MVNYFELGYRLVDGKIVLARDVKVINGSEYMIGSDKEENKKMNNDMENEKPSNNR